MIIVLARMIAIAAVVLLMGQVAGGTASAVHDSGEIEWGKGSEYWPNESEALYWMYYSTVTISDLSPGADAKPYRLALRNEGEESIDFRISLANPQPEDESYDALPDTSWVGFSRESAYDETELLSVAVVEVEGKEDGLAGEATIWVHVRVPRSKQWLDQRWQCRIKVVPEGLAEGEPLYSTLSISTGGDLSHAQRSTITTLSILFGMFLLSIVVVYAFVRWKWPNEPKEASAVSETTNEAACSQ
jgi:hypothetical protein